MSQHARKHASKRFRPSGMDWLEDRVVLSAGASTQVAMVAAAQASGARGRALMAQQNPRNQPGNLGLDLNQQSAFVDQVVDQINQQFGPFATQFYQLQASYFASLDTPPDSGAIDITTFHDRAGALVDSLTQQVLGVVNAVPGGGGLLNGYLQARLGGNQAGSLRHALTTLPAVGISDLDSTGFALNSGAILQDAQIATQNLTRLYDQSLLTGAFGFFSGTLRFFDRGLYNDNLPPPSSNDAPIASQTIDKVNSDFATFAQGYRNARSQYFNTVGTSQFGPNGDIQTFRTSVNQGIQTLTSSVSSFVNSVPGGSGPLSSLLTAWIGGNAPGSLGYDLVNLPSVSTSGLSMTGFALTGETYLSDALLNAQNSIQLYDASLRHVAEGFFNAYAGHFLRSAPGRPGVRSLAADPPGDPQVFLPTSPLNQRFVFNNLLPTGPFTEGNFFNGGFASRPFSGQNFFSTMLPTGPFTEGNFFNTSLGAGTGFFNFAPAAFVPGFGFGGLGSGFNFLGTETQVPFLSEFGTGFSFGPLGGLAPNVNLGFNPLIGINPAFGDGFGGGFGVFGSSGLTGFSGPFGFGPTFGFSPGFGDFFF